jgi:hypothetical protein
MNPNLQAVGGKENGNELLVKKISQPCFSFIALMTAVFVVIIMVPVTFIMLIHHRVRDLSGYGSLRHCMQRFFNDFVEFSSIQPDSTTSGTIVDFDPLALRHYQIGFFTYWAFHNGLPFIAFN